MLPRQGSATLSGVAIWDCGSRVRPLGMGRMIRQAFVLGAGLGKRLRPLTEIFPKPLVPLFHRPLAEWALDACEAAGCVRFAVNTHHLPEKWEGFAAERDVTFFHEPDLLETGGGLKNIEVWLEDGSLLIHNGDVFATLSLAELVAAHEASGCEVTLALRSEGPARHIALDAAGERVVDIHKMLGKAEGTHLFTGIYCVRKEFLRRIPAGEKISVIPAFLELAAEGGLGAVVLDEGVWADLGDIESYLKAHRELALEEPVHPEALIGKGAVVEGSVIGRGAVIGTGASVSRSVVWPGARVAAGETVEDRVVVGEA